MILTISTASSMSALRNDLIFGSKLLHQLSVSSSTNELAFSPEYGIKPLNTFDHLPIRFLAVSRRFKSCVALAEDHAMEHQCYHF